MDARDAELLTLSLRRRVPDEALARVFDCEPGEIARRRAGAIERLADQLGVQRGEELGAVLKALLEPHNWAAAGEEFEPAPGRGLPAGEPGPELERGLPASEPEPEPEPEPTFLVRSPRRRKPEVDPVARAPQPRKDLPAPYTPLTPKQPQPQREARDNRRRRLAVIGATVAVATAAGAAAFVGASELADDEPSAPSKPPATERQASFEPRKERLQAAPFASDPKQSRCYTTAYVRRATTLYRRPGGSKRVRISARTEFGSPRVLGVVRQSNGWLKVQAPELRNNEEAWIPRSSA
ncbi:MAG TPA: hypothetical protein VEQ61_06030, partial [Thermoleophilaceae bacterium]|nr:hypothetical protein [Thermoleophilaceae bacterium]